MALLLVLMLMLMLPLPLPAWAQSGSPEMEADADPQENHWAHTISGGLQVNPLGTAIRYDLTRKLPEGFRWSVFDNYLVYSNEVGFAFGWEMNPALVEAHIEAAAEPGFFIQARSFNAPTTGDGLLAGGERVFGWRGSLRAQVNINLQLHRIWLYSRTTGMLRFRDFIEEDTFQGIRIRQERWFEQATAVMVRFAGSPPPPRDVTPIDNSHWAYVEYTVGAIEGFGSRPNRLSVGVVNERWPWRSTTLNLDLYYSFAPKPIDGFGLIFAYWVEL